MCKWRTAYTNSLPKCEFQYCKVSKEHLKFIPLQLVLVDSNNKLSLLIYRFFYLFDFIMWLKIIWWKVMWFWQKLLILLGQYKWDENISLQYTSAFQTGVYGLWNIYVMGLIFLYAPSHKRWNNSDNTGKFTLFFYQDKFIDEYTTH